MRWVERDPGLNYVVLTTAQWQPVSQCTKKKGPVSTATMALISALCSATLACMDDVGGGTFNCTE